MKKREHLTKEIELLVEMASNRIQLKSKMRMVIYGAIKKLFGNDGEITSNSLNKPQLVQQPTQPFQRAEAFVEEPSYKETVNAIDRLKNSKAPGEDNIPIELIKAAGAKLCEKLDHIVSMVWESEELPGGLEHGYRYTRKEASGIVRTIEAFAAYKIFAMMLYDRIAVYTEEKIAEYRGGFRPGRGTIDQMFTVRQIMAKAYEYNIPLHQLLVDFKQAYDSLDRNAFFPIMDEFGIPSKLIRLTKATLTNTKGRILIQGSLSEPFIIDTGFKQGDYLPFCST